MTFRNRRGQALLEYALIAAVAAAALLFLSGLFKPADSDCSSSQDTHKACHGFISIGGRPIYF
jgi:hypothetical protein